MASDIDLNEINVYFSARFPSVESFQSIKQLKGGRSNPNYLLENNKGKYVLRRQPFGKLQKTAHNISREYHVLKALSEIDIPVPAVYHLCEDKSVIGVNFFLMKYIEGKISNSFLLPNLSNVQRKTTYLNMIDLLALLHNVDYKAIGLEKFGKAGNYYERQYHRWNTSFQESLPEGNDQFNDLSNWLKNHLPEESKTTLIHGDFRLDNIIFDSETREIKALLDWELSTLGDPLSDLGYFLGVLNAPSDFVMSGLGDVDRTKYGIPSEEEMLERYCNLTGRQNIPNWSFYKAFGYFRLSAICAGIQSRVLMGNAVDETSKLYGSLTTQLAEIGLMEIH